MKKLVVMVLIAGVGLWAWNRPNRGSQPDAELARSFGDMCKVAKKNLDTPQRGVDQLFRYFGRHTPAMMKQFGELLVEIEKTSDDAEHDRRARQAHKRLRRPLVVCGRTWEKFFAAVEADPAASAKFERGVNRVARSLELIFGGESLPEWMPHPLRQLAADPAQP